MGFGYLGCLILASNMRPFTISIRKGLHLWMSSSICPQGCKGFLVGDSFHSKLCICYPFLLWLVEFSREICCEFYPAPARVFDVLLLSSCFKNSESSFGYCYFDYSVSWWYSVFTLALLGSSVWCSNPLFIVRMLSPNTSTSSPFSSFFFWNFYVSVVGPLVSPQ